jgi:exoribonuclease R
VHITSPIRRIVDIINQTLFVSGEGIVSEISGDALAFCKKWILQIGEINTMTKSIRKLQNDCEWLDLCSRDPAILTKQHPGVLFEKRAREDATFSYMVYLEDLKRVARIRTIHEYDDYTRLSFRLFFFSDEDNVQTRVQLQPA